jgi:hypothetical protein
MSKAHQRIFVALARSADPNLTGRALARLIGVSPEAISSGRFGVARAVVRWNETAEDRDVPLMEYPTPGPQPPPRWA